MNKYASMNVSMGILQVNDNHLQLSVCVHERFDIGVVLSRRLYVRWFWICFQVLKFYLHVITYLLKPLAIRENLQCRMEVTNILNIDFCFSWNI